jgi:hypothetical protein
VTYHYISTEVKVLLWSCLFQQKSLNKTNMPKFDDALFGKTYLTAYSCDTPSNKTGLSPVLC